MALDLHKAYLSHMRSYMNIAAGAFVETYGEFVENYVTEAKATTAEDSSIEQVMNMSSIIDAAQHIKDVQALNQSIFDMCSFSSPVPIIWGKLVRLELFYKDLYVTDDCYRVERHKHPVEALSYKEHIIKQAEEYSGDLLVKLCDANRTHILNLAHTSVLRKHFGNFLLLAEPSDLQQVVNAINLTEYVTLHDIKIA